MTRIFDCEMGVFGDEKEFTFACFSSSRSLQVACVSARAIKRWRRPQRVPKSSAAQARESATYRVSHRKRTRPVPFAHGRSGGWRQRSSARRMRQPSGEPRASICHHAIGTDGHLPEWRVPLPFISRWDSVYAGMYFTELEKRATRRFSLHAFDRADAYVIEATRHDHQDWYRRSSSVVEPF